MRLLFRPLNREVTTPTPKSDNDDQKSVIREPWTYNVEAKSDNVEAKSDNVEAKSDDVQIGK